MFLSVFLNAYFDVFSARSLASHSYIRFENKQFLNEMTEWASNLRPKIDNVHTLSLTPSDVVTSLQLASTVGNQEIRASGYAVRLPNQPNMPTDVSEQRRGTSRNDGRIRVPL